MRQAARFQCDLMPVTLTRNNGSLPIETGFLDLGSEQLVLSALKQADDGRGLIVRIWNPTDGEQTAKLAFPQVKQAIVSATATDVLERDLGSPYEIRDRAVIVPCRPKQFVTLRVAFTPESSDQNPEAER